MKLLFAVIIVLLIILFFQRKLLIPAILVAVGVLVASKTKIGGLIDEEYYQPNLDIKNIQAIAGPVSLHIYTGDKNIILAGDQHIYQTIDCPGDIYFPEYLHWLFKNNPNEIFDIFTESFYRNDKIHEDLKGTSGLFTNYDKVFHKCYKYLPKKNWCAKNYPNVRFHLADYRWHYIGEKDTKTSLSPYLENYNKLKKNINNILEIYGMNVSIARLTDENYQKANKSLFQYILDAETEVKIKKLLENADVFWQDLLADEKLKRNYDACNIEIQNHIKEFIYQEVQNIDIKTKTDVSKLFEIKDSNESHDVINYVYSLVKYMLEINALIMDFYLLVRMLKKFDITKESYIMTPNTKNVIIIAGDFHIQRYATFLEKLKYQLIFKEQGKKCIDVQDMPEKLNNIVLKD
jgi:hypothetical protein